MKNGPIAAGLVFSFPLSYDHEMSVAAFDTFSSVLCTYTHARAYARTHAYTHTHMHIHTYMRTRTKRQGLIPVGTTPIQRSIQEQMLPSSWWWIGYQVYSTVNPEYFVNIPFAGDL